jgi:hypothetical protein
VSAGVAVPPPRAVGADLGLNAASRRLGTSAHRREPKRQIRQLLSDPVSHWTSLRSPYRRRRITTPVAHPQPCLFRVPW